jgi:DNA-directed RNA polymerase I, II, and III subunit RPABC3
MGEPAILLEDIFEIKNINPDGKKFDKVSRIAADSENYEMDLLLDVNTDVYPVELSERLTLALATTLDLEGRAETGHWDYGKSDRASLADRYEYVMYGRVFKFTPDAGKDGKVYVL